MYNLTQVLNSIQRGFIFIKWKQSEVVEVLNLLRGGILFLIETSGLFKFLFDVTNGFMVLTNPRDILGRFSITVHFLPANVLF